MELEPDAEATVPPRTAPSSKGVDKLPDPADPVGERPDLPAKRRHDSLCEDEACSNFKRLKSFDPCDNRSSETTSSCREIEDTQSLGLLSRLPEELILLVMSFVPAGDLVRSRRVSKKWMTFTSDSHLWKSICCRDLTVPDLNRPEAKCWEWVYLSKMRMFKDLKAACRVGAFEFPNGSKYMGDWIQGIREGYGVLIEKTQNRYEGEWKADKEHGEGIKIWKGGSRYEGEWADGKKHGKARIIWGDGEWKGDMYEGDWKEDHRDGSGVYLWANGDRYQGQWCKSKINGRGTKTWANGDRYEGYWKEDERHGCGVYHWPSGNRYEGQWAEGKTNGFGVKYWSNGDRYEGEWANDNRHGHGVYTWVSGTRYEGEWRDGKKDGRGICLWSDGAAYDGEWRSNFRHGLGLYFFPDGTYYEGEWSNNLRHGKGVQVWFDSASGQELRVEGNWREDLRIEEPRVTRPWDGFFLKSWDEQRAYIRKVLQDRKEQPNADSVSRSETESGPASPPVASSFPVALSPINSHESTISPRPKRKREEEPSLLLEPAVNLIRGADGSGGRDIRRQPMVPEH